MSVSGICWHSLIFGCFLPRFGTDFETQMAPRKHQNGAPNGPKSSTKIDAKYEGFQVPLGSVLGLSWVVWGSILGSKIMKLRWFYNGFVNIVFLKKIRLGRTSWTELGSILTPKRFQKDSQIGLKMEPKCDRKTIKK